MSDLWSVSRSGCSTFHLLVALHSGVTSLQVSFYTLITYLATSLGAVTVAAHQVCAGKTLVYIVLYFQVVACSFHHQLQFSFIVNWYFNAVLRVSKVGWYCTDPLFWKFSCKTSLWFCGTGDGWNLRSLLCVGRTSGSNGAVFYASSSVWFTKKFKAGEIYFHKFKIQSNLKEMKLFLVTSNRWRSMWVHHLEYTLIQLQEVESWELDNLDVHAIIEFVVDSSRTLICYFVLSRG